LLGGRTCTFKLLNHVYFCRERERERQLFLMSFSRNLG
jgi:hypothetical protein